MKVQDLFRKVFAKNNLIAAAVVIILIVSLIKGLQFLAVLALLIALMLVYPQIATGLPNLIRELIEEIHIGKWGAKVRPLSHEPDFEKRDLGAEDDKAVLKAFNEGFQFLSMGRYEEAVSKFNEVIAVKDKLAQAHLNLGAAYLGLWHQTGDSQHLINSIEASKKALEIDPEGYRSRLNLGVAYSKMRETEDEALKCYEEADQRGDYRDPVTWGKVKLFKADLIRTLVNRVGGESYQTRLTEAEIAALESLRLFEMAGKNSDTSRWIQEATSVLDLIRKQIEALKKHETLTGKSL